MTDPTIPVTATDEERQAFQRYRGLTLSQEDYDEIRAAERTRIFAALPAALQELVDMDIRGATREEFHQKRAAALVVAIEKELARHDHD